MYKISGINHVAMKGWMVPDVQTLHLCFGPLSRKTQNRWKVFLYGECTYLAMYVLLLLSYARSILYAKHLYPNPYSITL